jgi:hypothetical protein
MSRPNGDYPDDRRTDYVRSALRDAAQAYEPDRTAMVHRVASGRAAARAKARRGIYPVAAALAVAVIVVLSVVAVRSAGDNGIRPNPPAAAPLPVASPPAAASVSPSGSPSARKTTGGASHSATAGTPPDGTAPGGTATDGAVTAKGGVGANSVATWSETKVTITSAKPLSALRVTITVALTPGAAAAGKYTTVPNSDVTVTVTKDGSALTYAYVLKQGTALAPGSYLFAAQFDHHSGRSMAKDSYAVTGATKDGGVELSGAFI